MDEPETWRWVWVAVATAFAIAAIAVSGTFFLAPFAAGAVVAAVLAFAGIGIGVEWLAFVAVSAGSFAALRPLARRLDLSEPTEGIGAKRLIGQQAVVLQAIPPGGTELGLVRVHREEWRAETVDGSGAEAGEVVRVVDQRGTRLVVTTTGEKS